jgi:transcriptional regulator with GAF, ATPase, and Fis domain
MASPVLSEIDIIPDPWVTCFLSSMLIRYVEAHPPAAGRIDYDRIMGVVEGFDHIRDPKSFLLDPNNWIPQLVLRELIKRCEQVSGLKDVAYRAALAYFASASGRQPTLIETIATYLDGVDAVVRCSRLWATVYSNYLEMQAFARPQESRTLYILVRFRQPVDPLIGNTLLVKGNIEAFSKLYPFVDRVSCEEQYSQLRLSSIVAEFGDRYTLSQEKRAGKPGHWVVKERATGRVVASARPCSLGRESVPGWQGGHSLAGDLPGEGTKSTDLLRIEQAGVLRDGPLEYGLAEGAVYNAPYTRYRFEWQERPQRSNEKNPKELISTMLFEHLVGLQATQRRTLGIFIRNRALIEENAQLREELYGPTETGGMLGKSKPFQELLALVRTVALTDATVLLTGETGTGKERTARLIHHLSPRRRGRFLAINCGAIAENLLESELFGHERGAFSGAVAQKKGKFEQADGGTLFLDEIGEVSQGMQVKLLRVLQEREFQRVGGQEDIKVDVRIITATNQDLHSLVADRKFRQDLFYRLDVFPILLPPLRERTEDIPLIAEEILARHAGQQKKTITGLTAEALEVLMKYSWPGNIRELENALERAVTLAGAKAGRIGPELLPLSVREACQPISAHGVDELVERVEWPVIIQSLKSGKGLTGLLKRIEWALIRRAVKENSGNKTQAARLLGRTYRWLRKAETEMPGS